MISSPSVMAGGTLKLRPKTHDNVLKSMKSTQLLFRVPMICTDPSVLCQGSRHFKAFQDFKLNEALNIEFHSSQLDYKCCIAKVPTVACVMQLEPVEHV